MLHDPQVALAFIAGFSLNEVFMAIIKNLPTLAWVLLVPYLLYKNPQGREMLTGMFDDADAFTGVRAAANLPLFHLIALALFFVPTAIFPDAAGEQIARLRPVTGKNLTAATIACSLPMIFFAFVLFRVQLKRFRQWWTIVPAAGLLTLAYFGVIAMLKGPLLPLWKLDLLVVANMLLAFALIYLIRRLNLQRQKHGRRIMNPAWNYLAIVFCISLQMVLIAGSLRQSEWLFFNDIGTYNFNYLLMLCTVVVLIVGAAWAPNLQPLSPTFVLLGITLFYLLLGDLLSAAYLLLPEKAKYVLTGVALVFFYLMFVYRSRIHDIKLKPSSLRSGVRVGLDAYFEAWWKANIDPSKPGDIPVFLFAVQGGGSRAGFWISQLLNRLNRQTDGLFRKHVFAVTSASGGSSGFGANLALWRYLDEHPEIDPVKRANIEEVFARGMYQRNYLSGAFYQIFVGEIGQRIKRLFTRNADNRNSIHQLDEAIAFGEAIQQGWEKGENNGKSFFQQVGARIRTFFKRGGKDPITHAMGHDIPNYPMRPYLSYWYDADGKPDGRLPLFFPISLNIQSGRSGYASPVRMDAKVAGDKSVFIDAIDVLAEAERAENNKAGASSSLPLVGASHLSQLFPLMNAYTYIPGCGNFIDGGLFENQGFTVLTRLHDWLIKKIATLPADVRNRVKIHVVSVVNSSIRPDETNGPVNNPQKRISQLTAVMRALAGSGIDGRTTWWGDYMCEQLTPVRPTELIMQFPNLPTEESKRVPLGRWLSSGAITVMAERLDAPDIRTKLNGLAQLVKP